MKMPCVAWREIFLEHVRKKPNRVLCGALLVLLSFVFLSAVPVQKAQAQYVEPPSKFCPGPSFKLRMLPPLPGSHRFYFVEIFWKQYVLKALMAMTEQLTAAGMYQTLIVGTFFDAKHQLETQRLFQKLTAQAHKDYHSSIDMCVFGTTVRGVAAAQNNATFSAYLMSKRSQDRHLANKSANAAAGPSQDIKGRLEQFKARYCDKHSNDELLDKLCDATPTAKTVNRDVDYGRVIMSPYTLDVDWADSTVTDDEQDVLALAKNIYGHDVFDHIPAAYLARKSNQPKVLDLRSVVAKRSVAENSFNALVGMKTAGAPENAGTNLSADYARIILKKLGVSSDDEIETFLGKRPSYHALMELLTKKIYQSPTFYTNLYDKPVNVDRTIAAMQAFGLMQNMDLFKSHLRNEMLLSVVLELEVDQWQTEVQNRLDGMKEEGARK